MDFEAQLQEAAKHGHALVEKYIQECREKIDKSSIITHWQTNNISDWRIGRDWGCDLDSSTIISFSNV